MVSAIILLILFALIVFAVIYRLNGENPERVIPELRNGKAVSIYNGEKESGFFVSELHRIRAKPDFVYQLNDGSCAIVEYKSRSSGVHKSDITQL